MFIFLNLLPKITVIGLKATPKPVTPEGVEIQRMFRLHVFPKRCVRMRRYGSYNHTTIRNFYLQFQAGQKPDIFIFMRTGFELSVKYFFGSIKHCNIQYLYKKIRQSIESSIKKSLLFNQ